MDVTSLILSQAAENERDGDLQTAEMLYREVLKQDPAHPTANLRLGIRLEMTARPAEAAACLRLAITGHPTSIEAHAALGRALAALGESDAAMTMLVGATCLQALQFTPDDPGAWFSLGMAMNRLNRVDHAAIAYRRALTLRPDFAEAHHNLGICWQDLRRPDLAVSSHRRASRLSPDNADFHCNLAHALLSDQAFQEGFAEWEWRRRSPQRDFAQPVWDGEPFAGQTLLAHAEQGYGDVIQFCRYLPLAARQGGRLIVECRAPLAGLMAGLAGVDEVVIWGAPLPAFDRQIAIPSLPHACRALQPTLMTMDAPYLTVPAARKTAWRQRIGAGETAKVGLLWQGNAAGPDPRRAVRFADVARLTDIGGITWFSLQRERQAWAENTADIIDLGKDILDFEDLAAAISAMDLLISIDTAAAHLAGALGKPVWTLISAAPDWRWMPETATTPWYPSMRLYRQQNLGDWSGPVAAISQDLSAWLTTFETANRPHSSR